MHPKSPMNLLSSFTYCHEWRHSTNRPLLFTATTLSNASKVACRSAKGELFNKINSYGKHHYTVDHKRGATSSSQPPRESESKKRCVHHLPLHAASKLRYDIDESRHDTSNSDSQEIVGTGENKQSTARKIVNAIKRTTSRG